MSSRKSVFNFRSLTFFFCFLSLLIFNVTLAQSKSNKGKDFWVGFMKHIEGTKSKTSLYITSDSSTTGTVSVPGQSWSQNFTVTANTMTVVTIPSAYSYNDCSDCTTSKGVHVTSKKNVVVYAHHYQDNQSDATLVLPTRTLGKDYFIVGYNQVSPSSSGRNTFGIVAVKDNTRVKITPTQTISKNGGGTLAANVSYYVTLDEGEFYQGVASSGAFSADLTGSRIEVIDTGANANCRSIAVFSGSSYLSINSGCSGFASGDNLIEQMFPTNSWGSKFVLVPALGRSGDNFRFVAAEDKTEVIIFNTGAAPDILYLDKGEFGEITNQTLVRNVIATKPVMAVQYQRTASCDGFRNRTGDPSMTILNPLEQTLKDITLYSSSYYDIDNHYINVVIPTAATSTFSVDGSSKTFSTVPNNVNYSYARFSVSAGYHRLKAAAGFIATAYGEGRYESYGYAAGANVKDLRATASISNSTSNVYSSTCVGRATKFRGFADYNATKWEWFFGDGKKSTTQNPTHVYQDTGTYLAKLYVYKPTFDGCSNYDSAFVEVSVYDNPIAKIAHNSLCDSTLISFNDVSTIPAKESRLATIWNIDDSPTKYAKNVNYTFDTTGKFYIRMEVITENQCKDTLIDSLTVSPRPEADFTFSDVCFADSAYFQDVSTIRSGSINQHIWEFGSEGGGDRKSEAYFFADSGTYVVTMTVISDSGCLGEASHSIYKYPFFDVTFSYQDTCLGNQNILKNTTTIYGGSFTDTLWTTSSFDTATSYNFSKQFNSSGVYTVKLVMEQDSFCKDSFLQDVNVHPLAVPIFKATSTCFGDSTLFVDSSLVSSGSLSLTWNLDDGYTHNGDSARVKYASNGVKNIQLSVTTDKGCKTDTTQSITITNPEIQNLFIDDVCDEVTQSISFKGKLGMDSFVFYRWEIDGRLVSSDSMFDYEATNEGKNKISLVVGTDNGCTLNSMDSFMVHPLQVTNFTVNDTCLNLPIVPFENSVITPPSTITDFKWYLDGVLVSTGLSNEIIPANAGTHTLRLSTVSSDGCLDSLTKPFEVFNLPNGSFNTSMNCYKDLTLINNTSTIGSGSITSHNWSIDNKTFMTEDVSYTFPNYGTYTAELISTSDRGCKDTLIQDITIDPLPILAISVAKDTGCVPFDISIINNSSIISGSITTYDYSWGDGNTGTGISPSHTYDLSGSYPIKVYATSDKGCKDSLLLADPVVVFDNPKADFNYDPKEPSTLKNIITLVDSSSLDAIQWLWSVSDGSSYIGSTTQHMFADSGYYNITLRIINDNGCFDEITKRIYVNADLFIHIPSSFSPNGDGINDTYGLAGMTQGVFKMQMDIYNRWGEKVFRSENVNDRWDGNFNGKPAPQGVYIFKVRYTNPKQSRWFYNTGEIHLLR